MFTSKLDPFLPLFDRSVGGRQELKHTSYVEKACMQGIKLASLAFLSELVGWVVVLPQQHFLLPSPCLNHFSCCSNPFQFCMPAMYFLVGRVFFDTHAVHFPGNNYNLL